MRDFPSVAAGGGWALSGPAAAFSDENSSRHLSSGCLLVARRASWCLCAGFLPAIWRKGQFRCEMDLIGWVFPCPVRRNWRKSCPKRWAEEQALEFYLSRWYVPFGIASIKGKNWCFLPILAQATSFVPRSGFLFFFFSFFYVCLMRLFVRAWGV